jgi:hypothetical protein
VPFDDGLIVELLADDDHSQVRLRAGGNVVHVRFIQYLSVTDLAALEQIRSVALITSDFTAI